MTGKNGVIDLGLSVPAISTPPRASSYILHYILATTHLLH